MLPVKMRSLIVFLLFLFCAYCEGAQENSIEARGKKKKIAFLLFFVDLVVKKIFILKIIYAIAFWLLLHKAGYFFGWFVSYLKEQKHAVIEHPHHHDHYEEYGPPGYYKRKGQRPYSSYDPYSAPDTGVNVY